MALEPHVGSSAGSTDPAYVMVPVDAEINLLELAAVPLREWRIIALSTVAVLLLAGLYSLLQPTVYTADVVLLPPEASGVAGAGGVMLPFGLGGTDDSRLVTILESRSVADSVASRLKLPAAFGVRSVRRAGRTVADMSEVIDNTDGSIVIKLTDTNPERAARIANAYPEALNAVNARLGSEAAIQRAEYLETELAVARGELEAIEEQLVDFRRGQPEVKAQTSQTLEAAAQLQEQIMAQELRIQQLQRIATPDNPQLRTAVAQLGSLRGQLRRLRTGGIDETGVMLSFREAPELGLTYARLLREFEKNEAIYGQLTAGLAQARIDAGDDVPVVTVLDPAIVPGGPSGPNRGLAMILGALVGLVLGLVAAFAVDWSRRMRGVPDNAGFFSAWTRFRTEVRGLTTRFRTPARRA
ncbi:MAG: GumC family protein [Gemmatimonadota bacterium]